MRHGQDISERSAFACFVIGFSIGAIVISALISNRFLPIGNARIVEQSMQYADVITIVLAAVAVLVTVIGLFVAGLAVWGYKQISEHARQEARDWLEKNYKEEVNKFMESKFEKLVASKVDSMSMGNAEERLRKEKRTSDRFGDEGNEYGEMNEERKTK
jgi:hypothetical protein